MAIAIEDFTHETFENAVGSTFFVQVPGHEPVPLTLENVKLFSAATQRDSVVEIDGKIYPQRRAFSLTLVGAFEPLLPPNTYEIQHESCGSMAVYLSVFRQDPSETLYEVLFN